MSRSNPSENSNPNPAVRFFEWQGEKGIVRYYDKEKKENVDVGANFQFILLDQVGSVGGWHDASGSGIYSNLVKDSRAEPLVVKAFKGGTLVEGIYRDIKDRVSSLGGQFVANLYVGFKADKGAPLTIGVLRFKGAALNAWLEFAKQHRADLYKKAIRITDVSEGKKGRIVFRVPVFSLSDISKETDAAAVALDAELQTYFKAYFARTTHDRVAPAATDNNGSHGTDTHGGMDMEPELPAGRFAGPVVEDLDDSDIPF